MYVSSHVHLNFKRSLLTHRIRTTKIGQQRSAGDQSLQSELFKINDNLTRLVRHLLIPFTLNKVQIALLPGV